MVDTAKGLVHIVGGKSLAINIENVGAKQHDNVKVCL